MSGSSEKRPAVSVVMPVLDPDPRQLREAVASVLAQTLEDVELLVVEDPGPRSAGPVLRSFDDARIRHVENPQRTSMAEARNRGLALARADFVAMFDGDDVCEPRRLELQAEFLRSHPEVAVLGTALTVIDADGTVRGTRPYPLEHDEILRSMRSFNPVAHPSVMVRRDVVREAGGYGTDAGLVCEDYELWCRLAREGVRFANLEEPLVRYRLHEGATKSRRLRETLRATLRIKQTYWRSSLGIRGRLRMFGERLLLLLPPRLVMALFVRTTLRPPRPGCVTR